MRAIFRRLGRLKIPQKLGRMRSWLLPVFFLVALLVIVSQTIPLYTDWLWFDSVGFSSIFLTILLTQILLGLIFGGICFTTLYLNLSLVHRSPATDVLVELEDHLGLPGRFVLEPYIKGFLLPVALVLSLLAAVQAAAEWELALRFLYPTPFQIQDPLLHKDLSFFIFRFPFLNFLYLWGMIILVVSNLLVALAYILYRGIQITRQGLRFSFWARTHILILISAILFLKAWGYHLITPYPGSICVSACTDITGVCVPPSVWRRTN